MLPTTIDFVVKPLLNRLILFQHIFYNGATHRQYLYPITLVHREISVELSFEILLFLGMGKSKYEMDQRRS